MLTSFFQKVPLAPPDPILGLTAAFFADARQDKVNLGAGIFKDAQGKTPILQCVKQAEGYLLENEKNKEYLPIDGHRQFLECIGELIFGAPFWMQEKKRICSFQTVGGTGALKIGGTFLKEEVGGQLLLPTPTWPNHRGIMQGCGLELGFYPYYDSKNKVFDCDGMIHFLQQQKEGSSVLLHASCHNPTGMDPTFEEWKVLSDLMIKRRQIPFFDCAYQGFGEGLTEDVQGIRLFAQKGYEMLVAFSAAKNFSLYGERVGALFLVTENETIAAHVTSRIKQMIRANYSNPPLHGAAIVAHILQDPNLKGLWLEELKSLHQRVDQMRKELAQRLQGKGEFEHIGKGKGMFCFLGLSASQVSTLITEHGIYMSQDGRINVCGLNGDNIDYVVDCVLKV